MKINYKYTTLVLLFILIITYAWHWKTMFDYTPHTNVTSHMMSNMAAVHTGIHVSHEDMTMGDMVNMMKGKKGKDLEKEFIIGMIPHHQGAVDMAKLLLQDSTISPELRGFAENIIRAQDAEILMMRGWLNAY